MAPSEAHRLALQNSPRGGRYDRRSTLMTRRPLRFYNWAFRCGWVGFEPSTSWSIGPSGC